MQVYYQLKFEYVRRNCCQVMGKVHLIFDDPSYFSSYETGQSVGEEKTGEPREKTPDTPASRTWLVSHVASFARTHTSHGGEMIEWLSAVMEY